MIPVEGHKNLYRDENSGAVVNTDTAGYAQYKNMKLKRDQEKSELDRMRADIQEIKTLLKELVNPT